MGALIDSDGSRPILNLWNALLGLSATAETE